MTSTPQPESIYIPLRGDRVLSRASLPHADAILSLPNSSEHKNQAEIIFRGGYLVQYLEFLEEIIFSNRLVAVDFDVIDPAELAHLGISSSENPGSVWRRTGSLGLEDLAFNRLVREEILFPVYLGNGPELAKDLARRYLTISPELKERHRERLQFYSEKEPSLGQRLAELSLAEEAGKPLVISEFAFQNRLSYRVAFHEEAVISSLEEDERIAYRGLLPKIVDSFNEGSLRELRRLEEFGATFIFPKTPIAWEIVSESNAPEDLLLVALQLRDQYSQLRSEIWEVESQLLRDDVSLESKRKLVLGLRGAVEQLWPKTEGLIARSAKDVTGLLGALPLDFSTAGVASIASLGSYLLSQPADTLRMMLARRKLRSLFRSKRKFLKSKDWTSKLASIFGATTQDIRKGLHREVSIALIRAYRGEEGLLPPEDLGKLE